MRFGSNVRDSANVHLRLPMLEIIILVLVGRHIASIVRKKNRSPVGYVLLMIFAWYGGAICGAMIGTILAELLQIPDGQDMIFVFGGLFIGAISGLGLTYLVACSVPPKARHRDEYDDYEDYDGLPRYGRYEPEDDYDRPRRRRHDDYEDDREGRRRRSYDD
jgi:hypothetical protein